jgi:hypothetical protein
VTAIMVDDDAAQLAAAVVERDQLRALLLDMIGAAELARQIAADDARAIGAEAYERGERDGYERGARMLADQWAAHWRGRMDADTLAEVDTDRWGAGGREHFADPRPGDRTGAELRADAYASWGLDRAECLARWPHLRGTEIPGAGEWSLSPARPADTRSRQPRSPPVPSAVARRVPPDSC